jgi:hypothetical protein
MNENMKSIDVIMCTYNSRRRGLLSIDPYYRISKSRFLANRVVFSLAYRMADMILTQAKFYLDKLKKLYKERTSMVLRVTS